MKCILFTLLTIVFTIGCSSEKRNDHEGAEKIDQVLVEMIRQSTSEEERSQLQSAAPFRNIKGIATPFAGFSVPIGTNRAHISFTIDHLRKTDVDVLAKEAFEDLRTATEHR